MRYFQQVVTGVDVLPLLCQIEAHPKLWDQHPERRTVPDSPHAEMRDIWLRARAYDDIGQPGAFRAEHRPVFYPAWRALSSIRPIVFGLMALACGVELGNILITRLPPGGVILPHVDSGWAPEFYSAKFYVILRANEGCVNRCLDETVTMRAGEVWQFENRVTHSVENNGETERVALIVTLRAED